MTDSAPHALSNDQTFKQMESTLTDLANSRLSAEQARTAFRQEIDQAWKAGNQDTVQNELQSLCTSAGQKATPESRGVASAWNISVNHQNPDQVEFRLKDKGKEPVDVSLNLGQKDMDVFSLKELKAQMAAYDTSVEQRSAALTRTAHNYFAGYQSASVTQSLLKQELRADDRAGVTAKDMFFSQAIDRNKQDMKVSTLGPDRVGLSLPWYGSWGKRIEINTTSGAVKVDENHEELKIVARDLALPVLVGGLIGATKGVPGVIAGAAVGALFSLDKIAKDLDTQHFLVSFEPEYFLFPDKK